MYKTDDPAADWDAYSRELEAAEDWLPTCSECGERVYDDFCYEINDEIICEACLNRNYRKHTMDLMG